MGGTLLRKAANGVGKEQVVFRSPLIYPMEWSPQAGVLTYFGPGPTSSMDLYALRMSPSGTASMTLLDSAAQEMWNRLSPNGQWMTYVSNESGNIEVYVQTFPTAQQRWAISNGGGSHPTWSRDGRELFFLGPDSTLFATPIETTPAFRAGIPRALFRTNTGPRGGADYAVSQDRLRVLVNSPVEHVSSHLVVVLNWSAVKGDH
jgi:hypothetical protein